MSKRAHNFVDRTGVRYGKLVALSHFKKPHRPKVTFWKCICDCGKEVEVYGGHLQVGHTTSCGCYKAEWTRDFYTTHGHTKNRKSSREYQSWNSMLARCYNPNNSDYHNYGGRGVKVCDRWRLSFESFFADMGPVPDGHTIDRVDTNGDYEPGNCKWSTLIEQANNRRDNVRLQHNGKTQTIAQWSRELGIKEGTLQTRIKLGWSHEKALTTPVKLWRR